MFSSIFDPTNSFWKGFSKIMDLFGLSLCWLLCSLPLITLGAATTALYDSVVHGIRREEIGVYSRFFRTLRSEFKTSALITLPGLVLALLYAVIWRVAFVVAVGGNDLAGVLVYAYRLLFCVPLAVWLFAMATLSRFTFGPAALLKTAGQLVFFHLPSAAAVTAVTVFCVKVVLWWPFSGIFLPAMAALVSSFPLERIFAPFLEEAKEETQSP